MRIKEVTDQGGTIFEGEVYPFACYCGEEYQTAEAAWNCRKCRTYLEPETFANREVYHFTGDREPTQAELMEPTPESLAFEAMFDEDGLSDVEADAMTLRDAGMGTDEDYGYFGDDGDDW